jgi:hypothetical protein
MNSEIRQAVLNRAAAKRAENNQVKGLLQGLGFADVKVGHGGHGWLDIETSIPKPDNCYCASVPRNMGRCAACSDVWQAARNHIIEQAQAKTGRTGEYNGYIALHLRLQA